MLILATCSFVGIFWVYEDRL